MNNTDFYTFFRGFVRTKNKMSKMRFKNVPDEELMSLKKAEYFDEFAGILAQDTVLIDVDNSDMADRLYKIVQEDEIPCAVMETTRGLHFYFKNDGTFTQCATGVLLAIGVYADIKVGVKNSYSILKFNGKDREVIYDKFDDEEYATIPSYLKPVETKISLYGMEDGDGRNNALFSYILILKNLGMTDKDIKKTLCYINKYIFDEPLNENELATITRNESFEVEENNVTTYSNSTEFFTDKGTFLFNKFAKYIVSKYNIKKIDGQLAIYYNGVYITDTKYIERAMIEEIPLLNAGKRNETLNYINILLLQNEKVSDAKYIAFNNGILDIETGELIEFSPDIVITNRIPHNYVATAYSEKVDNLMNRLSCGDKQIRAVMEEMAGYLFFRKQELRKSFLLVGNKANGKSTFLDMLVTMIGQENVSSIDLAELGDRFKTAELFGKLANIGDDIGDEFISNPAVFKKLVSGDRLNAEYKGKDPFDFMSYAKLIFSANEIPRIKDKTGAVLDRMVIIPFNATFSKTDADFDPYIKYKLRSEECIEYLIILAVEGLKRVLENESFSESEVIIKTTKEYEIGNNPILMFLSVCKEEGKELCNNSIKTVYQWYQEFCISNGYQVVSNIEFGKRLKSLGRYSITPKYIKGKTVRIVEYNEL